ncbi:MAG: type II toxin-antitoxin system PemK/MazF family toxin [Elusimicrobia bacterium]|nr:type II toxin-antitoxin system PemK/MazF family toxin [Elusimicrobiota bacterium]
MKRGEVYWVRLDPSEGAEIKKTRPALVVSNDTNNVYAQTVTVLPLTTQVDRVYPFEVLLETGVCGPQAAKVKANQIRTVDKRRLGDLIALLPDPILRKVDDAVRLHLAL